MLVLFDTATVPAGDRLDRLSEAVGDAVVPVEIEHHTSPDAVAARCLGRKVGGLSMMSLRTTPVTLRRTARLAGADQEPQLLLERQQAGRRVVTQDRHRTVLKPGDMSILDTARPYTSAHPDGVDEYCVRVSRAELGLPEEVLSRAGGMRLDPRNPVADLAASYLSRLADQPRMEAFETPTIELIRAVILTQLGDGSTGRQSLEDTLALRIMDFARRHLTNRDLNAAKIAAAHNISVRHLYATLARSGIVLGEWIREQRLEGCRRDLARTDRNAKTISYIAHRWGFGDATHFSRAFRAAFGMSPREWRALHAGAGSRAHATK
ncbi:helix-turn-helix domain-containing protein [Streptosporangium sp. NPDC051022]|uniref:helix-turn-helix domain-containing protein n=1 Tax=Streptosporangium sp. NPDC051022 TaxID=3155752 RepID=UPI0034156910